DTAYTQALNDSGLGTGGKYQKALQAATAAIQGLAGNNLGQALAGGASPYLAGVIKDLTTDPQTHQVDIATNTLAHAILGAVAAEVSGNNALAGAAGAASGELAAQVLIKQLYGDGAKVSELTEEQKQTISTLSTLAAGLAGGIAGDSSASALTGAQAGKTAVDNNFLGKLVTEGCAIAAPCRAKVAEKVLEIGVKAGITGIVAKEIADKISSEDLDHLIMLQMMGNDEITQSYLNTLQNKYTQIANPTDLPTHTGGDQSGDIRKYPNHTGGNQQLEPGSIPNHTGNEENLSGVAPNNTGNTEGKPDTGGNTTITPIPEKPNKDDLAYLALKGKEAQEAAGKLGFDRRIAPPKAPFNSHGQPVFFDGKTYITPDVDSHNVTNGWKMFDRRGKRMGTYDSNLNRVKD
ncbi:VENN motif pre-toxin domain-containing protein, partial [Photorhabdus antumapuensis]|uniref:VENN motif pre-toxin domain-containing protein n=1 Tax=Photorhabdus antumapuensis TaxID=2862867 RepID=UPI001CECEF74